MFSISRARIQDDRKLNQTFPSDILLANEDDDENEARKREKGKTSERERFLPTDFSVAHNKSSALHDVSIETKGKFNFVLSPGSTTVKSTKAGGDKHSPEMRFKAQKPRRS